MAIRYLKITLILLVALQALIYAIQNVVNIDATYQSIAYVISNQDHQAYPFSVGPDVTNPIFIWITLAIVLTCEFSAGIISTLGAYHMWQNRQATSHEFNSAKHYAIIGCLVSMVTWFGLFMVVAAAYFQMWQTAIGDSSYKGAFMIFTASALILVVVSQTDD
ncbi:DUF2165 family protein [Thalassotalea fonticola]|uniref:DUF2165 family protein n=1 Tax=Thalassotalea fonticola TaxID=3065649 RepID=A0ABZ0GQS8_9GAMM|nr:DUF2165 family protein [Colwelliaceae bacterium S1-1]